MDMVYGFRYRSNAWYKHDKRGSFYMTIEDWMGRKDVKDEEPSLDDMAVIDGPDAKIEVDDEDSVSSDEEVEETKKTIIWDGGDKDDWLQPCLEKSWDSGIFYLKVCYEEDEQELVFTTVMPDDSWLGIGFGTKMKNADMISWQTRGGRGIVRDLYSFGYSTPSLDKS
jgi:hypothetical protein